MKKTLLAVTLLLLVTGISVAQTVNLTAQSTTVTLPDGKTVDMWGYCTPDATGPGTPLSGGAACGTPVAGWKPGPTITVAAGSSLSIALTNNLPVPTSVVILGQIGGLLGQPARDAAVVHAGETQTTWPGNGDAPFNPPTQGARARSFVPEAGPTNGTRTYIYSNLKPGTYIYEAGSHPSIQVPMGLYGLLIVTQAPVAANAGCAYPGATSCAAGAYDADAAYLFSEIDAVQNKAVAAAALAGADESRTITDPLCASSACYPAAVNYAPTYLLINGQSFDASNPAASSISVPAAASTGNIVLRFANAGSRTHIPTVVGLPMALIAEDGNVPLGLPKIQTEVLLTAGKTYDVVVKPAGNATSTTPATAFNNATFPIFDRQLGTSINNQKNGGMQAYLVVGAGSSNWGSGTGGLPVALQAAVNNDAFTLPINATTFAANVLTNDVGVTSVAVGTGPSHGTLALNADGTFTYTPTSPVLAGFNDSFTYTGNTTGTTTTATVTLSAEGMGGAPTAQNNSFTSKVAGLMKVSHPGALTGASDPTGFTLKPVLESTLPVGNLTSFTFNDDGSFTAAASAAGVYQVQYHVVNSQNTPSASATLTLTFPSGSNLHVTVQDAQDKAITLSDYRWVIEEDTTFHTAPGVSTPPNTPTLATSFHSSYMPVVASGCVGPISCGQGQSVGGVVVDATQALANEVRPERAQLESGKYYYVSILPGDGGDAAIAGAGGAVSGIFVSLHRGTGNQAQRRIVTATTDGSVPLKVGDTVVIAGVTPAVYDGSFLVASVTGTNTFTYQLATSNAPQVQSFADGSFARVFNSAVDCTFGPAGQGVDPNAGICGHIMGGATVSPAQTDVTVLVERSPIPASQLSIFVFEDNNPTNGDVDTVEENQGLGGFSVILNDPQGATGDITGQVTYDQFGMPLSNYLVDTIDTATGLNACYQPNSGNSLVGVIITCPEFEYNGTRPTRTPSPLAGHALIKNVPPYRWDVIVNPGADREGRGETWVQTSTLEGTHANDAFSKAGEPAYFQEFGPPGFHAFVGFVNPASLKARTTVGANNSLCRNASACQNSLTGKVTMLHMSRPSNEVLYDSGSNTTLSQTTCYVGLNSSNGTGENIAFQACNPDGTFTFSHIPADNYQVVVWDQWLDQIINYTSQAVPDLNHGGANVQMGNIPVFSWFTRVEMSAFMDSGTHNPTSGPGISQIPMTVRFRDGSISNTLFTDSTGHATFNELFPLFNWYVVEADTTRYKATANHVVVDGGGPVDGAGAYQGVLSSAYPVGGTTERTDTPASLSYGLQGFISQTQVIDWGKTNYAPGETGGILGMVVYASTRPFDDPTLLIQNTWAPGVPRVTVNLYQETGKAADGSPLLHFVESALTSSWDDTASSMSCPGQLTTDPFYTYSLSGLPGGATRCYDGFHNWNQVQPAVYDGRYLFKDMPDPANTTNRIPLPAGKYVVEVVVPDGYQLVKEEDKNILIGDAYIGPVTQQFAGFGNIFILPDQATLGNANPNAPLNGDGIANNATIDLGNANDTTVLFPTCVGNMRVVPDLLSLYPGAGQVAPFAGATRPLCDRKEVVLQDQMQANANFYVYTETQIASHFTGMVLDDASAEFNMATPDFGEKFAVPFVPVSIRNFNGVEVSRTYTDQYGMFNGLVYSSWEVNPPTPTGFTPNMMITCMNDPGPVPDGNGGLKNDDMYNPNYSNFCYTNPFMPGRTDYLDTPVLPVAAFASGYNPVDCAYPDTTPAIKEADGDGVGPYVAAVGNALTITSWGIQTVPNNAYIGPGISGNPATGLQAQKTITRNYGFGSTAGTVTIAGIPLTNVSWGDGTITGNVPAGIPACALQQSGQPTALCGELVITAANGKKTVDTVMVTVGGKAPTRVTAPDQSTSVGTGLAHPIQDAIDNAQPGDLIILGPGTYPELVVMWKPVRLQGVGAASTIINAAKYPTEKLAQWRPRINCAFGLDGQGNAATAGPLCGADRINTADPLPGQEITGGVVLLEPSVLGTEEGAGITVLAKNLPQSACGSSAVGSASNFLCAPSRIDGIGITGGDAGGGIYVNGWAHNLEISNNRIYGNAGVFSGGVRVGQPYLEGQELPAGIGTNWVGFGYDKSINIHHNKITNNGTVETNTGLAGGGGGVSLCSGTDNYHLNYNFICGNYSQGDGGGVGHVGLSQNDDISNNSILFNQSFNQSSTTNGGGLVIEGEPGAAGAATVGTGNVKVDSNLFLGNHAQGGSGGGVRLQQVNGADIGSSNNSKGLWQVSLSNNMIVNNVAGFAGGGISLLETTNSFIINNTVASNDSTATAGIAFPNRSQQSSAQPAGISSEPHGAGFPRNAATGTFSDPVLNDNIIYKNRSFYFLASAATATSPSPTHLYLRGTTNEAPVTDSNYSCPITTGSEGYFWDLGIVGDGSPTPGANHLHPQYSVLSNASLIGGGANQYASTNITDKGTTLFAKQYCNGPRSKPGTPDLGIPSLNPVQNFTMLAAATEDEGGNWIDVRFGPLSLSDSSAYQNAGVDLPNLGDYHLPTASAAIDAIPNAIGASNGASNHDFDGRSRPQPVGGCYDMGANEVASTSTTCTTGGGGGGTTKPTLTVLDNFDRANANTLNNGTNWSQLVALANAGIRVNNNQAFCINTGIPAVLCVPQGNAIWNSPTTGFGTKQAAAFTFASAPVSGTALVLKGSGGSAAFPTNFIRVRYTGSGVDVATTTNAGVNFTNRPGPAGFTTGFVSGDTLTAQAEANGTVSVWKTSGTTSTFLGSVSIPTSGPGAWTQGTGGGRIGMQLPAGARVDNFAGGTLP